MLKSNFSSKGVITIPVELRRKYDLLAGSKVTFEEKDGQLFIKKYKIKTAAITK